MLEQGQSLGAVTIARDDAGVVHVAPTGSSVDALNAPTTAVLDVAGGAIVVDISSNDATPSSLLTEPYWAQSWVAGVYGQEVAAALEQFEDPDFTGPVDVDAVAGYLTARVNRIGLGFWLHRWWPAEPSRLPELDDWLLELELGGLAWLAEACFVESDEVESLLEPHVEKLVAQLEGLRAFGSGTDDQHLLEVLTTALRATVDALSDDVPGYQEADGLLARIRAEEAAFESAAGSPAWDALLATLPTPELVARGRGGAASTREVLFRGSATADWRQLPPRIVLGREDNLAWQVTREDNAAVLEVRVLANPSIAPDTDEVLFARAYSGGLPETFALLYDASLGAFSGTRVLREEPSADLVLDVYSAAYVQRPRLSDGARATARSERVLVVDVIARRRGSDDAFVAEQAAWARWQG
jgi:hypothetical protein